jgi:putative serine protease PepD
VPSPSGQSSPGNVGLGFAIPVDFAKAVSDEIIATGSVTHAFLGLQVVQIPPAAARQAGTSEGLLVAGVTPGGPAAGAGLQTGDIITKINGQSATDPNQLAALTLTKRAGDSVLVTYERNSQTTRATIKLGAQT